MGIKGLDAYLTTPPDEEGYCEVCGQDCDRCVCPECPVCETYGDPDCYDSTHTAHYRHPSLAPRHPSHGLIETNEQIASMAEVERYLAADAEAEAKWLDAMSSDLLADLP